MGGPRPEMAAHSEPRQEPRDGPLVNHAPQHPLHGRRRRAFSALPRAHNRPRHRL